MMHDLIEDRISCRSPNKRLCMLVVDCKIFRDRAFKRCNTCERSAADAATCDFGKEAFNAIEPTCARRREVKLEAWMRSEPPLHSRRLVRPVVVEHQMNSEILWNMIIDPTQEAKKFLVSMSAVAGADDLTRCNVERREQRRDAVTRVIVRLPFRHARSHRENGLGPIERLNLGFLVDAQYDGAFGRGHIQADNISHFLNEERVCRKLERFDAMGLEPKRFPDAMHRRRRQARFRGHLAHAPMCCVGGSRGQRFLHDFVNAIVANFPRCSRTRRVTQALKAHDPKALAPFADGLFARANLFGDFIIGKTAIAIQENSSTMRQLLRRFWPACPTLQRCALSIGHVQRLQRTAHD